MQLVVVDNEDTEDTPARGLSKALEQTRFESLHVVSSIFKLTAAKTFGHRALRSGHDLEARD